MLELEVYVLRRNGEANRHGSAGDIRAKSGEQVNGERSDSLRPKHMQRGEIQPGQIGVIRQIDAGGKEDSAHIKQ